MNNYCLLDYFKLSPNKLNLPARRPALPIPLTKQSVSPWPITRPLADISHVQGNPQCPCSLDWSNRLEEKSPDRDRLNFNISIDCPQLFTEKRYYDGALGQCLEKKKNSVVRVWVYDRMAVDLEFVYSMD